MTVKNSIDYKCGDGWRNLVDTAIDQIRASDKRIEIDEVKQKLGGLRIYYHPHNDAADEIVRIAEKIASQVCEQCGSAARTQKVFGWWETLCPECVSIKKNN